MAVSGLPETCYDNARHICAMALEMMKMSKLMDIEGEPIEVDFLRAFFTYYTFWLRKFLTT